MASHADNSQQWDPNEVGPPGVCLRCFTPDDDTHAFCPRCGHVGTVFTESLYAAERPCANHPATPAIGYCCLCARPICGEC